MTNAVDADRLAEAARALEQALDEVEAVEPDGVAAARAALRRVLEAARAKTLNPPLTSPPAARSFIDGPLGGHRDLVEIWARFSALASGRDPDGDDALLAFLDDPDGLANDRKILYGTKQLGSKKGD